MHPQMRREYSYDRETVHLLSRIRANPVSGDYSDHWEKSLSLLSLHMQPAAEICLKSDYGESFPFLVRPPPWSDIVFVDVIVRSLRRAFEERGIPHGFHYHVKHLDKVIKEQRNNPASLIDALHVVALVRSAFKSLPERVVLSEDPNIALGEVTDAEELLKSGRIVILEHYNKLKDQVDQMIGDPPSRGLANQRSMSGGWDDGSHLRMDDPRSGGHRRTSEQPREHYYQHDDRGSNREDYNSGNRSADMYSDSHRYDRPREAPRSDVREQRERDADYDRHPYDRPREAPRSDVREQRERDGDYDRHRYEDHEERYDRGRNEGNRQAGYDSYDSRSERWEREAPRDDSYARDYRRDDRDLEERYESRDLTQSARMSIPKRPGVYSGPRRPCRVSSGSSFRSRETGGFEEDDGGRMDSGYDRRSSWEPHHDTASRYREERSAPARKFSDNRDFDRGYGGRSDFERTRSYESRGSSEDPDGQSGRGQRRGSSFRNADDYYRPQERSPKASGDQWTPGRRESSDSRVRDSRLREESGWGTDQKTGRHLATKQDSGWLGAPAKVSSGTGSRMKEPEAWNTTTNRNSRSTAAPPPSDGWGAPTTPASKQVVHLKSEDGWGMSTKTTGGNETLTPSTDTWGAPVKISAKSNTSPNAPNARGAPTNEYNKSVTIAKMPNAWGTPSTAAENPNTLGTTEKGTETSIQEPRSSRPESKPPSSDNSWIPIAKKGDNRSVAATDDNPWGVTSSNADVNSAWGQPFDAPTEKSPAPVASAWAPLTPTVVHDSAQEKRIPAPVAISNKTQGSEKTAEINPPPEDAATQSPRTLPITSHGKRLEWTPSTTAPATKPTEPIKEVTPSLQKNQTEKTTETLPTIPTEESNPWGVAVDYNTAESDGGWGKPTETAVPKVTTWNPPVETPDRKDNPWGQPVETLAPANNVSDPASGSPTPEKSAWGQPAATNNGKEFTVTTTGSTDTIPFPRTDAATTGTSIEISTVDQIPVVALTDPFIPESDARQTTTTTPSRSFDWPSPKQEAAYPGTEQSAQATTNSDLSSAPERQEAVSTHITRTSSFEVRPWNVQANINLSPWNATPEGNWNPDQLIITSATETKHIFDASEEKKIIKPQSELPSVSSDGDSPTSKKVGPPPGFETITEQTLADNRRSISRSTSQIEEATDKMESTELRSASDACTLNNQGEN